ncbi:NACHT domain-containing protein [Reichenbachiella agarivorans]|uniref:NACHT domain-containing protein n=1 Tax=Reichenbachiella agarivorans TaxID=2979464 RepID=A0ABY6CMQ1_9BACT|nr:NACHT domain-containing protein [Reichenbachiella agarivorans]UXP31786.1 NACHT domain-containing protein [Reichenbachiella agarivorans]
MEEKILETFVSSFVTELVKESKSIFSDLADEGSQLIKTGLKRYLTKQKDKYSHLKTLLRGNTPVYLYDIYYPLKLINRDDESVIKTNVVSEVFSKSNFITIIGDAGSGKSTLIKHLFLNSIYTKHSIPILVELRYLNEYDSNLDSYIIDKVLENKIAENPKILERLFQGGKFTFFLDGYDELNSEIKTQVIESLNSFINQFPENNFILTTRPYSDIEHLQLFHNYYVKSLSLEEGEIEGFVYKQLEAEKEVAGKIVESIETNDSEYIQSFLTNPLLLSLFILTFQSNAAVPGKKYIFYRRVIQALFSEHDSKTKLGFVREKHSNLKQEEFEELLKVFCFLSYFESNYSWDIDYIFEKFDQIKKKKNLAFANNKVVQDLKSAIALWVEDNGEYSFAHRSLQEYFSALFVKNLNPDDNARIYQKIIDRFAGHRRSLNEIENFLSLLEEMDSLNFKRYYYLPLLNELRSQIDSSSNENLYLSLLKFFARGVVIPTERAVDHRRSNRYFIDVIINDPIVYRAIFIHLPFTRELDNVLRHSVRKPDCKIKTANDTFKLPGDGKGNEKEFPFINFDKTIPDEFNNECYKPVLKIAKDLDKFIDREILKTESFIKNSIDTDKDLVDLI